MYDLDTRRTKYDHIITSNSALSIIKWTVIAIDRTLHNCVSQPQGLGCSHGPLVTSAGSELAIHVRVMVTVVHRRWQAKGFVTKIDWQGKAKLNYKIVMVNLFLKSLKHSFLTRTKSPSRWKIVRSYNMNEREVSPKSYKYIHTFLTFQNF